MICSNAHVLLGPSSLYRLVSRSRVMSCKSYWFTSHFIWHSSSQSNACTHVCAQDTTPIYESNRPEYDNASAVTGTLPMRTFYSLQEDVDTGHIRTFASSVHSPCVQCLGISAREIPKRCIAKNSNVYMCVYLCVCVTVG